MPPDTKGRKRRSDQRRKTEKTTSHRRANASDIETIEWKKLRRQVALAAKARQTTEKNGAAHALAKADKWQRRAAIGVQKHAVTARLEASARRKRDVIARQPHRDFASPSCSDNRPYTSRLRRRELTTENAPFEYSIVCRIWEKWARAALAKRNNTPRKKFRKRGLRIAKPRLKPARDSTTRPATAPQHAKMRSAEAVIGNALWLS